MADFCKQCSTELFNEDFGDLEGLITEQAVVDGKAALVLCEGCGPIVVNHLGECIDPACTKHREEKK